VVVDDETSSPSDSDLRSTIEANSLLIASAAVFVVALLAFLLTRPRKPKQAKASPFANEPSVASPQYADVPSAPELSTLSGLNSRR
jgi:hypothetical protein